MVSRSSVPIIWTFDGAIVLDMKEIAQVVPYLPPKISGVGDYAVLLAKELAKVHGLHSTFICANPNEGQLNCEGFPVIPLVACSDEEFSSILMKTDTVLVHYVGYGFQKRGCPIWLVNGLLKWRKKCRNVNLITMFHELYATGPIWSSAFWTNVIQKRICRRIASICDGVITNRAASRFYLDRHCSCNSQVLPVFSNVGEAPLFVPFNERNSEMVIFGGGPNFRDLAGEKFSLIQELIDFWKIEKIVIIGNGNLGLANLSISIEVAGILDSMSIHSILSKARFGLLTYFPGYMGKSGIFASYCAHGLAPVLLNRDDSSEDGLSSGMNFLYIEDAIDYEIQEAESVAEKAWSWYSMHNISRVSEAYAEFIR
ncbi:glycosyltransferase family 4 protein [Puniceicoccaceae bacterium K14]|nr:glycosyltransferase family 4 protein [Puniceicoccaceae bacterium K14]